MSKAIMAGVLCLIVCMFGDSYFRTENDIYPANVFYNLALAVERSDATAHYGQTSKGFSFKASSAHPADSSEIYVLVIGETARADNFGIYGYHRDTTPLMSRMPGLTAFSHALTQSNTTHKSVPMLLSAADATDYDRIYRERSVITAFREAGFHTVFLSNQKPNHSFIDFFGMEADEWKFIKDGSPDGANTPDERLVPLVAEKLAEGHKKLFIVLHTYGSHFNYRERYPASDAFFKPDDATEAKAANRQQLINAYDNSIAYTSIFLKNTIDILNQLSNEYNVILFYASDHGESLGENGIYLHAAPYDSAPLEQLHIPAFIWMPQSSAQAFGVDINCLKRQASSRHSHDNIFHSFLGLGGIQTQDYQKSLDIFATCRRTK